MRRLARPSRLHVRRGHAPVPRRQAGSGDETLRSPGSAKRDLAGLRCLVAASLRLHAKIPRASDQPGRYRRQHYPRGRRDNPVVLLARRRRSRLHPIVKSQGQQIRERCCRRVDGDAKQEAASDKPSGECLPLAAQRWRQSARSGRRLSASDVGCPKPLILIYQGHAEHGDQRRQQKQVYNRETWRSHRSLDPLFGSMATATSEPQPTSTAAEREQADTPTDARTNYAGKYNAQAEA